MKLVVEKTFTEIEWAEVCTWLIANYDNVRCYDGETTQVNLQRLRVWLNWAMEDDDDTIGAHFSLIGDDDLVMWFRLRFS